MIWSPPAPGLRLPVGCWENAASQLLVRFKRVKPPPVNGTTRAFLAARSQKITGYEFFGRESSVGGQTTVTVLLKPKSGGQKSDTSLTIAFVQHVRQMLSGLSEILAREGLIDTRFVGNVTAEEMAGEWFPQMEGEEPAVHTVVPSGGGGDVGSGAADRRGYSFNLW